MIIKQPNKLMAILHWFPNRVSNSLERLWLVTSWGLVVAVIYIMDGGMGNFSLPYSMGSFYLPYVLIAYFYIFITVFRNKIMKEYSPGKGSIFLINHWKKVLYFGAYMMVVSGLLGWPFEFAVRWLFDVILLLFYRELFLSYAAQANFESTVKVSKVTNLLWGIRERTNHIIAATIFHAVFAISWYWCTSATGNFYVAILYYISIDLLLGVKNHGEKQTG